MEIQEVNELIRSQESDYNEIKRIITNIKKDSATRKTQKYIIEKRELLREIFERVEKNHLRLQDQEILSSHKYLTSNYFETIHRHYEEGMVYLTRCEERLQLVQSVYEPKLDEENEDKDIVSSPKLFIQLFRMSQLTKKTTQAKESITENKPLWHLQTILHSLQKQWTEFEHTHIELLMAESTLGNSYFKDNCFESTQKDYELTTELLEEKIFQSSNEKDFSYKSTGKLPRINIPIFSGNYDAWYTFQDLFKKIIHEDKSISSTEKMQYLKTHVKGDAARLIRHLTISEVNYITAWNLLTKRYEDERMITNKFIDKLLDLPKMKKANAAELRDMHDTVNECIEALKNQGISTATWDPILIRIISRKWDEETDTKYEDQLQNRNKLQSFSELMKFMENRFKCLRAFTGSVPHSSNQIATPRQAVNNEKFRRCWYCESNEHIIHQCPSFKSLNISDRYKTVIEKRMCKRCLNHDAQKYCVSEVYKQCEICQHKGHNTLLHRVFDSTKSPQQENNNSRKTFLKNTVKEKSQNKTLSHISAINLDTKNVTLLATAVVRTMSYDGVPQLLRVLCDQGSEASFCTEEVAQILSYPRQKIQALIKGIGDEKPKTSNYTINITLQPRYSSDYKLPVTLIVLPKLTSSLPRNNLPQLQEKSLDNALIADPNYYKKGPIDIILGAQEYSKILLQGFERLQDGIIAQNTAFGWILSGFYSNESNKETKVISMVSRTEEIRQLTKFWEFEEIPQNYKLTEDDQICENNYRDTTIRNPDGTYTVRLPFKDSNLLYGDSRKRAAARLLQLERQFTKNDNLRQQYIEFMNEYLHMGHMKEVPKTNYNKGSYYIPHQAVIKEGSLTTKLRVVFDASSKTSTKISLNDNLYKGPRLQQDLSAILLRWRTHKIAFMADIMKMYRFIKINEADFKHQRILWRFSPSHAIKEYVLTTVTYGTSSAPYLAVRTLQQLAIDEQYNYPIASKITLQDFFVDDILSGSSMDSSAKELIDQLIAMLNKGGFTLRKWSSNSPKLLENIPAEDIDDQLLILPLDENRKSLGISWSPRDDSFYFKITITHNEKPTKRFIMSEVAKIFDPLGWLAPIIIRMKLLVQELWTNSLDWDQPVDDIVQKTWSELQKHLINIENIKVPRWCYTTDNTEIELYGFCDASEKAYGAVVYSRIKLNDSFYITLLQAKSKVAPKKQKTTLPRLELCAALLLAGLVRKVKEALNNKNVTISCWTDSMITLGWIRGEPNRWQTFVANRVSEINQLLPNAQWNHVISSENPADIISRGINPEKLIDYSLWWNGPEWLKTNRIPITRMPPQPNEEVKHCHIATVKTENNEFWNRFSSFDRMIRVLSYCIRFRNKQKINEPISCTEIRETTKRILCIVQQEDYTEELKIIKSGQLSKKNKLSTLDPFIDECGLIRVGGRLQNAELPYNTKHPVLLPYNHYVTSLIIQDAHIKTLHGGNKLTLSFLRQNYWIINGKRKVKTIVNKCVKCIRYKGVTSPQKMGILPKVRVTQSHPFSHSGVDFAGPIQTRAMKGRGHKSYKSYIAVFVCLATKAIHLELVGDLTTETFIAALRRFMARRGHVSHMYSDNATNFVGAANFLHQEILQVTQSLHFQNTVASIGTQWHFIPASSPHFGGIWESSVKAMKHHLRRVVGDSKLTYEEMITFLHQIEACLNSRPLCAQMEDNINDTTILTPSHFLIGREAVGIPDPISNINTDLVNRWKYIQRMKRDFWNSWTKDYLHQLQQRYKWKHEQENIKIGTVVLIKDDDIAPSRWPLAKIKEVHPGEDGVVRVVTIQKSAGACLKRSIHTLVPLPVNINDSIDLENQTPVQNNIAENRQMITNTQNNIGTCTESRQMPIQNNLATVTISNNRSPRKHWIRNLFFYTLMIMMLIGNVASTPTYSLKNIDPGLYVEQIGTSTINRGTFRIEADFKRERLEQDLVKIMKITMQFRQLCSDAQNTVYETHCDEFYHHLNEEKSKFETIKESLIETTRSRKRRGLLGQMLTSVFGVNDEVYSDIETLSNNQQKLIDSANHQTKIMISTISTVNQTEQRIEKKLEKFQTKLNEAISFMNNRNVWYKSIDRNHVKIQVMQAYELANNYITEIMDYYNGLLEIYIGNDTIYRILTPSHINAIIRTANQKLPSNIKIIQDKLIQTKINGNETHIRVYAYYPIHDVTKYTLIHVTPIPERKHDGSFQCLAVQQTFMGIDYNNERYFELSQDEFRDCLRSHTDFICYPVVVKNMQLNKNCIVEQLFGAENHIETQCTSKIYKTSTEILWKQLYMQNTWLFITTKPVTASIVCDGQREEITIEGIGVLHISDICVIKTRNNVLAAKRTTTVTVLASYTKATNFTLNDKIMPTTIKNISEEEVLDSSKGVFDHLLTAEANIQTELDSTVWKQIKSHTYITSFSVSLIIIALACTTCYFGPQIIKCGQAIMTARRSNTRPAQQPTKDSMPRIPQQQHGTAVVSSATHKHREQQQYGRPRSVPASSQQPKPSPAESYEVVELYEMESCS